MPYISNNRPALIGIPFDANSSYMKGTALAPPLIREALYSNSSNLWSEYGINLGQNSVFSDEGDLTFSSKEKTYYEIEQAIKKLLDKNLIPISLGGDHSITFPILKAINKKHPKLNILQLDAHPDLYEELGGNRLSHASPFARIMENKLANRLLQLGIRTNNEHQRTQQKRFNVESVDMKSWSDDFLIKFDAPVYISFDLDALDPAFAPGVSHFEPGGFSTRQVITIIQNISAPKIIGADIVEFNPKRDQSGLSAMVCAKILKELIAIISQKA